MAAVVRALEQHADESQQVRMMALCGYGCAEPDLETLRKLKKQAKDQRRLLALINEHILWCGEWVWEGDHIRSTCGSCGCPLVRDYGLELSPTLCLCSRGWVEAIFTEAFGRPVDVSLVKAIGRGDECCEFSVHLGKDAA